MNMSLRTNNMTVFKGILNFKSGNNTKVSEIDSPKKLSHEELVKKIDYSYLPSIDTDPQEVKENVDKYCIHAKKYKFASVCIRPDSVKLAKDNLEGSNVKVATVIGFPRGKMESLGAENIVGNIPVQKKVQEANKAIADGADELHVVMNVSKIKENDKDYLKNEASQLIETAKGRNVKFIIETGLLSDPEIEMVTKCILEATKEIRAFKHKDKNEIPVMVKTSTGMVIGVDGATKGATVNNIKLIKNIVKDELGIKASGGITNEEKGLELIEAGADRLGCSANIAINPDNCKYCENKFPAENIVTIYGSSRTRPGTPDYYKAYSLGKALGEAGYGALTGGGDGSMEAVNKGDATYDVGVCLEFPGEKPNQFVDERYMCETFYDRLDKYRERSGYQGAVPGGMGTIMEVFDMWTMLFTGKSTGKHQNQVILFDKEFWKGLVDWLKDQPLKRGFISKDQLSMLKVVDTNEEFLAEVKKGIDYDPRKEASPE